jgi:hypothetical protein
MKLWSRVRSWAAANLRRNRLWVSPAMSARCGRAQSNGYRFTSRLLNRE